MKLNLDCMKDILLRIESGPYGEIIKFHNWDDNEGAQFSCHVFR